MTIFEIRPSGELAGVIAQPFGFLLLGALRWASRVRRYRTPALRFLQACAIAVVIAVGLIACSGGGQGATVATGTTTGTYSITITGTTTTAATRTIGLVLTAQ